MLQSLRMLVLRTHTSTPSLQARSMKDSLRYSQFIPHFSTLLHCGSKKTQKNSWTSIILEMVEVLRSLLLLGDEKNPNTLRGSRTIESASENIYTVQRFPWTWFSLEFLHPQTTERKGKEKPKPQKTHPKTPSKQPGVCAIYCGFFPVHKQLNKKTQTNHHKSTGTSEIPMSLKEDATAPHSYFTPVSHQKKIINVKQLHWNYTCLLRQYKNNVLQRRPWSSLIWWQWNIHGLSSIIFLA